MYGGAKCYSRLVTQRPSPEGVSSERMERESDEEPLQLLAPDDPNRRKPWSRTEVEEVRWGCVFLSKSTSHKAVSLLPCCLSLHKYFLYTVIESSLSSESYWIKKKENRFFCLSLVLWTKIQPSLYCQVIPPPSLFVIDKRFHLSDRLFLSLTLPADKKQDRAIKLDCFSARVVNTRPKLNLFIKLFICGRESWEGKNRLWLPL